MKNKIFDKIASLFRKSEIEKQAQKSHRKEAIPEQEHARHKGIGSIKERLSSIFTKRKQAEENKVAKQPIQEKKQPISNLPIETDVVLSNFREEMSRVPTPDRIGYRDIIEDALEGAIDKYGEEAVARTLQSNSSEIANLLQAIYFDSNQERVQANLTRLISLIENSAMDVNESQRITDATEQIGWEEVADVPEW